jgi:hypothetical protein
MPEIAQAPAPSNTPESDLEEIEIAKFWANRKGEAIIVKLTPFKGRWFVDARRFYTDKQGKFAPTAKGICLPLRKLDDLTRALAKAKTIARDRGLIEGDE